MWGGEETVSCQPVAGRLWMAVACERRHKYGPSAKQSRQLCANNL